MTDDLTRLRRTLAQDASASEAFGVPYVPVARVASTPEEHPAIVASPEQAGATGDQAMAHDSTPGDTDKQGALDALRARYEADAPHAQFVTDHHSIVFGEGDPNAGLMFIGEAPGAEEDKTGRPFVGRAGQLLEKMIIAMGLSREAVYITNVLKTRPPNNATPTVAEAELCEPYLHEQIRIIRPEAIVTLGLPATRLILKTNDSMGRLRGRWGEIDLGNVRVPVMPTYHPAFLLRSYTPDNRAKVWSDLQMVIDKLGLPMPAAAASGGDR